MEQIMTQFYTGQIVRRRRGWSPMRVIGMRAGDRVEAVYCGAAPVEGMLFPSAELVVVGDPAKEFKLCDDWELRLSDVDIGALRQQLAPGVTMKIRCATYKSPKQQETATQKGNEEMTKLYQTKEETPRFGTLLATNSAGKLVLELKGSGEVIAFDKKEVTEVRPYTVSVRFIEGGNNVQEYAFLSRKGDVEVDDLVMIKGYASMARVVAVNTNSSKATVELVGRKVATVPFGEDSAAVTE